MNILDPQGPIGAAEKTILIDSVVIMLAIVLPTIIAIFAFAFWFRASNAKAIHWPNWEYSGRIELVVWSIPTLTIILLGGVAWIGAHQLDPAKAVEGSAKPLTIQVVSLDWKWLFIYPDQKVATINTLTVPAGVPLHFELTSSSVMSAFFIPQFGSMIYTMNGMATQLNLRADTPGTFQGLSAHFSGDGFSDMHFDVHVVPSEHFSEWAQDASRAEKSLDERSYSEIAKPSMKSQSAIYSLADPQLFNSIVMQNLPPSPGAQAGVKGAALPAGVADAR
ncbi:cytochrome o ubiquinol oxidase subunit 2 [Nitrobacteraceae bacterium AZCC 2161]